MFLVKDENIETTSKDDKQKVVNIFRFF